MRFVFRKLGFALSFALIFSAFAYDALARGEIENLGSSAFPGLNLGSEALRDDEIRAKAFEELRKGNWAGAKELFEKVLASSADDVLSLYGNSVATFNLRDIKTAQTTVEKAIKLLSASGENSRLLADCYVLAAVIFANQKDNERAIETLSKAIRLHPDHYDANISLARAYFGNSDLENAALFFRKAVTLRPTDLRARFFLATTQERLGNSKKALKEYREILRLDQNSLQGNLGLGVLLLKEDGSTSAEGIEALEKVIAVRSDVYEARITLGKTYVRLKKYE
ncbi:MAG: tetratricopeptide repeat protein, partial [Pyrinomonadaceae bacterium]|nr:tetratricopeptide repeat protein [Pyrinomonadaceae bacterium]